MEVWLTKVTMDALSPCSDWMTPLVRLSACSGERVLNNGS
ncbi:Uncharacterised protein [Mycobacteroides abscessus subsp. abscessus]|nr:Uncharacterised protein [Mycobacteroides abscessus subsp. abscessus]